MGTHPGGDLASPERFGAVALRDDQREMPKKKSCLGAARALAACVRDRCTRRAALGSLRPRQHGEREREKPPDDAHVDGEALKAAGRTPRVPAKSCAPPPNPSPRPPCRGSCSRITAVSARERTTNRTNTTQKRMYTSSLRQPEPANARRGACVALGGARLSGAS